MGAIDVNIINIRGNVGVCGGGRTSGKENLRKRVVEIIFIELCMFMYQIAVSLMNDL